MQHEQSGWGASDTDRRDAACRNSSPLPPFLCYLVMAIANVYSSLNRKHIVLRCRQPHPGRPDSLKKSRGALSGWNSPFNYSKSNTAQIEVEEGRRGKWMRGEKEEEEVGVGGALLTVWRFFALSVGVKRHGWSLRGIFSSCVTEEWPFKQVADSLLFRHFLPSPHCSSLRAVEGVSTRTVTDFRSSLGNQHSDASLISWLNSGWTSNHLKSSALMLVDSLFWLNVFILISAPRFISDRLYAIFVSFCVGKHQKSRKQKRKTSWFF